MFHRRRDARFCTPKCRLRAFRKGRIVHEIPAELTSKARWVRRTSSKRPVMVDGSPASSTDPGTWTDYRTAAAASNGAGLGFVLNGDGIGVIDLDHCLIDGRPTEAAAAFLADYRQNWIEVSTSGDGLHIWCRMEPGKGSRTVAANGLHVERYTQERYIALGSRTFQKGAIV
jgi:primase-polymerase (primpol)-like protein